MAELPTVAILGRPNVGKSTLFNRLVGRRLAIVDDTPGVTRDRNYGKAEWRDRHFLVIDTGGFEPESRISMSRQVTEQARLAVEEADLILLVVDAQTGLHPMDQEIARLLRHETDKPLLLIVNKVDTAHKAIHAAEFSRLGFAEAVLASAEHGRGIGDLLDRILQLLPPRQGREAEDTQAITIAVVGRPNVGKSSLVNRILGEPRVIVSPEPGTTRDAIDTPFAFQGQPYVLVDTAGIRAKSRVAYRVERYSILRAVKSLERCDVALIVLDATGGVVHQDARIAGYAAEAGCASILIVNKWDLIGKDVRAADQYLRSIREKLPYLNYAPVIFVSALTGQRVLKIFSLVERVMEERQRRIPTGELSRVIAEAVAAYPPPPSRGREVKIRHATQVSSQPPTFALVVSNSTGIPFSYERYLINRLREAYGFEGSPIRLRFREHRRDRPSLSGEISGRQN